LCRDSRRAGSRVSTGRAQRPREFRVVIGQGEVWWADLGDPVGSAPGFRRPVLVVQGDALNRSALAIVVCVPLTSQVKWAGAAGNVLRDARLANKALQALRRRSC
jgi:mRNA-degrading endonuclease toxin of MazEF toxin-antitoxin module